MGGILDILHLGSNGIGAARRGMHVTGENITNVNTPGYHRREVLMEPAPPIQRNMLGAGVRAAHVQRVVDRSLDGRVRDANSQQNFDAANSSILSRTDAYFQDFENVGVLPSLDQLLNSFDMLATAPHQTSYRQEVLHSATELVNQLNLKGFELRTTQESLNGEISSEVGKINDLLVSLSDVNNKIETQGGVPNNLFDRQSQLLDELSGHVGIKVFEQANGTVEVHTSSGFALLIGDTAKQLNVVPDLNGHFQVMGTDGGGTHNLSTQISGGSLGGVLQARNVDIQDAIDRLDTFTVDFATTVNGIHSAGYGLDGVTGRNFFDFTAGAGAAEGINVSADILGNPGAVAAASSNVLLPGDNTNALQLSDLRNTALVGTETAVENLRNVLSDFGARVYESAQKAVGSASAHTSIAEVQQSISGVSMDEEMVNLLSFQQQFSAAAQVVRAVDEILSEVIALKR